MLVPIPLRMLVLLVALTAFAPVSVAHAVGGGGEDSAENTAVPSYAEADADVSAGRYRSAIDKLKLLVRAEPGNADAWNLLAYASRKSERYRDAAKYYDQALKLEPNHRGALEYQGELFIATGKTDLAKANLERLAALCGTCEEYEELRAALSAAGAI